MPPSQWVKLRQYKSPIGSISTSDNMLAPVVVKPETTSKKASTGLVIAAAEVKRECSEQRNNQPRQCSDNKAFRSIKSSYLWLGAAQQKADYCQNDHGHDKSFYRFCFLMVQ